MAKDPELAAAEAEEELMMKMGMPSRFTRGGTKRQKLFDERSNLNEIKADLRPGQVVSNDVNQLVLTYAYSHRPELRRDMVNFMPNPKMIVHNIWPSVRVTTPKKGYVSILPLVASVSLTFSDDIPRHLCVPQTDPHSIHQEVRDRMEEIWFPLTEGVSFLRFQNYNWYKHCRFHYLQDTDNFWSRCMTLVDPVISSLMTYLIEDMNYIIGTEYKCTDLVDDVEQFFGVTVNVRFASTETPIGNSNCNKYWKEVRVLYDKLMINRIPFNSTQTNTLTYAADDTFVFESLFARHDLD